MDLWTGDWMLQLAVAVKVVIAAALGAIVGMEREMSRRPAGLRTHALLAAAAALLVAAIAVAVATGELLLAVFVTLLSLAVLRALRRWEQH